MGTPHGDTLDTLHTSGRGAATGPGGSSPRLVGLTLVVVSAVAFGTMPIMGKVAYRSGAEPVSLMAVRFTLGALVLAAIRRFAGRASRRAPRRAPWPPRRDLTALFLLGAVGYFAQSMAYFSALQRIPAALVAILLYLYPALVVVVAALFLHERPTRAVVACLTVAIAGSALTVGPVRGTASTTGLVLGVLAALVYAAYIVLSSRVVARVDALTSIVVVASGAACSYDLAAVVVRPSWPGDTGGWLAAAGIGLVATVVAMLCFFAGLARVGPSDASVVSTVEPVVSVLLGVVVLGETLGAVQYVGAVLVLTAVAVLARLRSGVADPTAAETGERPDLAPRAEQDQRT